MSVPTSTPSPRLPPSTSAAASSPLNGRCGNESSNRTLFVNFERLAVNSAFLRAKLGTALARRHVKSHIFKSAAEALAARATP